MHSCPRTDGAPTRASMIHTSTVRTARDGAFTRGRGSDGRAVRSERASSKPPGAMLEQGRRAPVELSPAAPPLVHQLVHHLDELAHRPALLDDVAGRRVERHHAVADAPAPLALGVEPDDALDALADLTDG